jgi:hypothetical protein
LPIEKKKGCSNCSGLISSQIFSSFSYVVKSPGITLASLTTSLKRLRPEGEGGGTTAAGGGASAGVADCGGGVELGRTALVIACTVEHAANAAQALATAKFRIGKSKTDRAPFLALPLLKLSGTRRIAS